MANSKSLPALTFILRAKRRDGRSSTASIMIPRHCFPLIHSSSVLNLADASKESFQDICDASNVAVPGLVTKTDFTNRTAYFISIVGDH